MADNDFDYFFLMLFTQLQRDSISITSDPFLFMKHKNRYVMFVLHLSLRCRLYYWVFHIAFQRCMTHQVERGIEHHDATLLSIMEFYNNCMGLKDTRTHDRRIYNYIFNSATCAHIYSFYETVFIFTHRACVHTTVGSQFLELMCSYECVATTNDGISPKNAEKGHKQNNFNTVKLSFFLWSRE